MPRWGTSDGIFGVRRPNNTFRSARVNFDKIYYLDFYSLKPKFLMLDSTSEGGMLSTPTVEGAVFGDPWGEGRTSGY